CVRDLQMGTDFPGDDVANVFAPDAEYCQLICTQHHLCQFFTFLTKDWRSDNRQKCHLKYTKNVPSPPTINNLQNVVSGFSQRGCSAKASSTR
ncbi:Plasma kallikrein, partial [Acipenser ruthenus]